MRECIKSPFNSLREVLGLTASPGHTIRIIVPLPHCTAFASSIHFRLTDSLRSLIHFPLIDSLRTSIHRHLNAYWSISLCRPRRRNSMGSPSRSSLAKAGPMWRSPRSWRRYPPRRPRAEGRFSLRLRRSGQHIRETWDQEQLAFQHLLRPRPQSTSQKGTKPRAPRPKTLAFQRPGNYKNEIIISPSTKTSQMPRMPNPTAQTRRKSEHKSPEVLRGRGIKRAQPARNPLVAIKSPLLADCNRSRGRLANSDTYAGWQDFLPHEARIQEGDSGQKDLKIPGGHVCMRRKGPESHKEN